MEHLPELIGSTSELYWLLKTESITYEMRNKVIESILAKPDESFFSEEIFKK